MLARSNAELLGILVDAGADLDARDERGRTAVYLAATRGEDQALVNLLSLGAGVDVPDSIGWTP